MIKQYLAVYKRIVCFLDMTIICLIFPIALKINNNLGTALKVGLLKYLKTEVDWNLINFSAIFIIILPIWFLALYYSKAYSSFRFKSIMSNIRSISQGSFIFFLFLSLLLYFMEFKLHLLNYETKIDYSFVLVYPSITSIAILFMRTIFFTIFRMLKRTGYNKSNIIIVGTGPRAIKHIKKFKQNPQYGLNVKGLVALQEHDLIPKALEQYNILGSLNELENILNKYPIDEVFFIVPRKWLDKIDNAVLTCDLKGITVHIAVDLFNIKVSKSEVMTFGSLPVLSFNTTSTNYTSLAIKRVLDIILSITGIVIFFPFALIIACLIKMESKGPAIFSQVRCTKNGRTFKMFKFRTMIQDAEKIKTEIESKNEQKGPVFKMKNDPRTTKLGHFLRKTSIDEVPQLINVFLGQMSIVGPRPPIPSEVELYEQWQKRRLSMKSGITCIWQVSGRNKIPFEEWMTLDLNYIDNWSLLLDIKILLKTIPAVIFTNGSY